MYKKGKRKGKIKEEQTGFWFTTDLPVSRKNVGALVQRGRMRWKIENEGFNTQKKQGYCPRMLEGGDGETDGETKGNR